LKCPTCGYHGVGNFCSECGHKLTDFAPIHRVYDEKQSLGSLEQSDSAAPAVSGVTYAGFGARFLATLLDGLLISLPIILIVTAIYGSGWITEESWSGADAFNLILAAGITILLWVHWGGRTPGKKLVGVRIVQYPGLEPMTFGKAALRYFIGYTVSALLLGLGFLMVAFRKDKRGLHDIIAGTCVIHEDLKGR